MRNIDVAFFPMNVPAERLEPAAAIECLAAIKPTVVYPYHYDQEWVRRLDRDGTRQTPSTRGLQALAGARQKVRRFLRSSIAVCPAAIGATSSRYTADGLAGLRIHPPTCTSLPT